MEPTQKQIEDAKEEAKSMGSGGCCEPQGYDNPNEVNGICPSCGLPTVDGDSFEVCGYSPVECDVCGYAPCDQSC